MSINLKSEQFKNDLYNLITESELPISNVFFVFQLMCQQLETAYYDVLRKEAQENEKKKEEQQIDKENNELEIDK